MSVRGGGSSHFLGPSGVRLEPSGPALDVLMQDDGAGSRGLEQLQAEAEAFASKEEHYTKKLEELSEAIVKTQDEIRELKKAKSAKTGKGAVTASLMLTKGMQNQVRACFRQTLQGTEGRSVP
jgi:hypothetical protein